MKRLTSLKRRSWGITAVTEPTLDERIEKLRELEEKATPGPWAWEPTGDKSNSWALGLVDPPLDGKIPRGDPGSAFNIEFAVVECVCESGSSENLQDARLIVSLRNHALAIIEELRDAVRSEEIANELHIETIEELAALVEEHTDG